MPQSGETPTFYQNSGGTIQTFTVPASAGASVTFALDISAYGVLATVAPGGTVTVDVSQGYYYASSPQPSSFTATGSPKNGTTVVTAIAATTGSVAASLATANQYFVFTGATGNATVTIPTNPGQCFVVFNSLASTDTLTVKNVSANTGITVAQGKRAWLVYDSNLGDVARITADT